MGQVVHGMSNTPVYRVWSSMLSRCNNVNHRQYADYGGRGIKVCAEWHDFATFMSDMGPRPEGATLDRLDNNKGYTKSNCRWATWTQQQRNRRSNRYITIDGVTKLLVEWVAESPVGKSTIQYRLSIGWDAKAAVFTPGRNKKKGKAKS